MKIQPQNVVAGGHALGRMPAPDGRDALFPMRAILPPVEAAIERRKFRFWNANQWWGNQMDKPWCVAFATLHLLEDGPVTYKKTAAPLMPPHLLYKEAQENDEWEGTNYDGTSARGAMKALVKRGIIKEYRWASSVEETIAAVLSDSPVLLGTNWYRQMSYPEPKKINGIYRSVIKISGPLEGGHETLINGVNVDLELFRVKNSWGREWGDNGHFWITFKDLARLLYENGDICLPVENPEALEAEV